MRQAESKTMRGRGRPARPPEEAREAAVQAATWLLLHEGYAATTMEAVARSWAFAAGWRWRGRPRCCTACCRCCLSPS